MPLEAFAINAFSQPIMKETVEKNELKKRIQSLYQKDNRYHNFVNGMEAIEVFDRVFFNKNLLYVGIFNDKPICVVAFYRESLNTSRLEYLAMHHENINRGIEEQFIKLILKKEVKYDEKVNFVSNNLEIEKIIKKFQKMLDI